METIIASLIVGALSGLAFLSYRHRAFYLWVSGMLEMILSLLAVVTVGVGVGTYYGWAAVHQYFDPAKIDAARGALFTAHRPLNVTFGVVAALWLYLRFLRLLPTDHNPQRS